MPLCLLGPCQKVVTRQLCSRQAKLLLSCCSKPDADNRLFKQHHAKMKPTCLLASHKGEHGAKSNSSLLLWTLSLKTATYAGVRSDGLTGEANRRVSSPSPVRWNVHPRCAHQLNSLCAHCSSRVLPENWQGSRAGQSRHDYTQWPGLLSGAQRRRCLWHNSEAAGAALIVWISGTDQVNVDGKPFRCRSQSQSR